MKITDAGVGLSAWRRRVLPVLLALLRMVVAYMLLAPPIDMLWHDPLFLKGFAPHAAQYVLAVVLAVGGGLFVASPTVVIGALVCAAGLCLFEYCWWRIDSGRVGSTLITALALLAVLASGEWLSRRLQRRVYGGGSAREPRA